MKYKLDTSGDVGPMPAGPMNERFLTWSDLSPFAQGYIEALFADLTKEKAFKRGDPVRIVDAEAYESRVIVGEAERGFWRCALPGAPHGFIGKAWHHSLLAYDLRFLDLAPETLARIIADCERSSSEPSTGEPRAEGAAFWRLRNACDYVGFPPLTFQLGDDGKVRFA